MPTPRRRSDHAPKKSPNLISRSDAATLRGVTRSAVTHACAPDGPLFGAIRGKYLDKSSPEFAAWVAGGETSELRSLMMRKRRAEIERLEMRNLREQNALISRALVKTHVIGLIQELFLRLLRYAPPTIAMRVGAAARSGATQEELTKLVYSIIQPELAGAQRRSVDAIRRCQVQGNLPPMEDDDDE